MKKRAVISAVVLVVLLAFGVYCLRFITPTKAYLIYRISQRDYDITINGTCNVRLNNKGILDKLDAGVSLESRLRKLGSDNFMRYDGNLDIGLFSFPIEKSWVISNDKFMSSNKDGTYDDKKVLGSMDIMNLAYISLDTIRKWDLEETDGGYIITGYLDPLLFINAVNANLRGELKEFIEGYVSLDNARYTDIHIRAVFDKSIGNNVDYIDLECEGASNKDFAADDIKVRLDFDTESVKTKEFVESMQEG